MFGYGLLYTYLIYLLISIYLLLGNDRQLDRQIVCLCKPDMGLLFLQEIFILPQQAQAEWQGMFII